MGKSGFHRLRFPFLLASSFRRFPRSKKSLVIASVCVAYLLFALVGYTQQHQNRRINADKYRHISGLYESHALPRALDLQIGARFTAPTRSNVVYITLKSKLLKPANIRGTIRPKLRRKSRRVKSTKSAFTQGKLGTLAPGAGQIKRSVARRTSWGENKDVDFKLLNIRPDHPVNSRTDSQISSIRIYSQRAPPWLSAQDVKAMRFLADAKVSRVKEVSRGDSPPLLVFEGETSGTVAERKHGKSGGLCGGLCGVISSPVENTEVFAFHLDRVLGLNRTLPAVSRNFRFIHGTSPDTRANILYFGIWNRSNSQLVMKCQITCSKL